MMHQHFSVEVLTDCVKTTSLFKTAPLKSFCAQLWVHPRFVPSPEIIIYVLTFPLMYCPTQPILQRHRRAPALPSSPVTVRGPARSELGADSQKKGKKKKQQPHDCVTPAPWGHLKGQQYWITVWSQRSEDPGVNPSQSDGDRTCMAGGGRRRSPV